METKENVLEKRMKKSTVKADCEAAYQYVTCKESGLLSCTVVDLFFESLTEHLIRLGGLYAKMAEFINVTNESFSGSDIKMTENMGD